MDAVQEVAEILEAKYRKGASDFEAMCETIIQELHIPEDFASYIQDKILDEAQRRLEGQL